MTVGIPGVCHSATLAALLRLNALRRMEKVRMSGFEALTMDDVAFSIEKKEVDTFLVAFCDMQGRLVGRRLTTEHFMADVLNDGMRVPAYLLAADANHLPADGFSLANRTTGYGDLLVRVDTATLHRMPWQPGTVGVLGDLEHPDGTTVTVSPRAVLKRQARRLEPTSLTASLGMEPQFTAFQDAHEEGLSTDFSALTPLAISGGAHSAFRSARGELLLRQVRRSLGQVPIRVEGTVALASPGQYEVTLRPADLVTACDHVAILRAAVKEIAADEGFSATFMASYSDGCGSASHLNLALRGMRGNYALAERNGADGLSEVGRAFIAGVLQHVTETFMLYAPNVNSYRRFGADRFTPSAVNWGHDNRTCALRVVGTEAALRIENRVPGSDANPYLATAAMVASGVDGINQKLQLEPAVVGDGHHTGSAPVPASLEDALAAWVGSAWVTETFGGDVQDHYANLARVELDAARTGSGEGVNGLAWERARYFEGT